jgi:toxin HigB-1
MPATPAGADIKATLDRCIVKIYTHAVIRTWRHRGLKELFETGKTAAIDSRYHQRLNVRLDFLDKAEILAEMRMPGWNLHPLKRDQAGRHAIAISGPWRITFEFKDKNAYLVDFEQYH